jgi:transcriptional regulator with XRE-family HTH domain
MHVNVEKLEKIRAAFGENVRDFAVRIGVSHQWYYNLINSKGNSPNLKTVAEVGDKLNLSVKDLII